MKIKTESAQVACLVIAHEIATQSAKGDDDEKLFQDYLKKFKQAYEAIYRHR